MFNLRSYVFKLIQVTQEIFIVIHFHQSSKYVNEVIKCGMWQVITIELDLQTQRKFL